MFWKGVSVLSVPNITFKNMLKDAVMQTKDAIGGFPAVGRSDARGSRLGERPPHRGEGEPRPLRAPPLSHSVRVGV